MTSTEFARRIDHTILKPEASAPEVHRVVADAMQYQFASVCVAPVWVGRVATMLRGSGGACLHGCELPPWDQQTYFESHRSDEQYQGWGR